VFRWAMELISAAAAEVSSSDPAFSDDPWANAWLDAETCNGNLGHLVSALCYRFCNVLQRSRHARHGEEPPTDRQEYERRNHQHHQLIALDTGFSGGDACVPARAVRPGRRAACSFCSASIIGDVFFSAIALASSPCPAADISANSRKLSTH